MKFFNREREEAEVAEALKGPAVAKPVNLEGRFHVLVEWDTTMYAIGPFKTKELAEVWKQGALFVENDDFSVLGVVRDFEPDESAMTEVAPGERP